METIGLLLGAIFWPTALVVWLIAGYFAVRKFGRPARIVRNVGVVVWIALVAIIGYSLYQWLVLDEPLSGAVSDGNLTQVRSLLQRGANPNADFEGTYPLVDAAESGNADIVRLLLKNGARLDAVGMTMQGDSTALMAAKRNGHAEVVRLLKSAGARR